MKYNPKTNEFEIKSKRNKEIYYIRLNPKTKTWICTCWKSANRPYEKWGYCNHILELLKKYDPKHYLEEKEKSEKANKTQGK